MMYEHILLSDPTLSINGVDFYVESLTASEPVQRREFKRTSLMNGTEYVSKGKWIGRQFTFTTTIHVPIDRPDAYDDILMELCNGVCEVVSLDMGSFNAEVTFTKAHDSNNPDKLTLNFTVKEIAEKSSIPDDEIITPPTEVVVMEDDSSSK